MRSMNHVRGFSAGRRVRVYDGDKEFGGREGKVDRAGVENGWAVVYVSFENRRRPVIFSPDELIVL